MSRPSPLWKALGANQPVFFVDDGSGYGVTMNDRRITSIGIEAGTTMAGLSTAAATVEVTGYQGYLQPEDTTTFEIRLTNYGADLLSSLTGKSAGALQPRFRGRVTAHDVTDTSDGDRTTKMRTVLTAQDWPSFIGQLDKGALAVRSDPNLWRVYRSLFTRAGVPGLYQLEAWGTRWHWVRFTAAEDNINSKLLSTSDVLTRYLEDVGNFIRQDRNGYPKAWSHDHLQSIAEDWRVFAADPLQRSQVLSPVTWRRPATIPKSLYWQQTTEIGFQSDNGVGYSYTPSGSLVTRAVTLDMMHLWDIAWEPGHSGYTDAMRARFNREKSTDMVLDTVTVDVLRLIQRNQGTDRAVAGHVLNLTHGDPIALGYDWPSEVRGVHFAQKVSHKVTRDEWTVSLDLVPAHHVTGAAKPTDLAGRTWDTAYPQPTQWETPSTSWEASP